MTAIFAHRALLPTGWHDAVRIETAAGRIASVAAASAAQPGDTPAGIVVPGLCNAHSHAFQRALAGHTEQRAAGARDNFWSWRERMYRLAGLVDARRLEAIAAQAYGEMLESGYTTVAEFHYLHSEPGQPPSEAMFDALQAAASATGIRLTYVPVLYERGGFEDEPLNDAQLRFRRTPDELLAHYRRCREQADEGTVVGLGAHSLRAVSETSLAELAGAARADGVPFHLHIAEQQREVEQSLAVRHRRPVRWLLEHADVDERWCLVHATHVDADEVTALAASGAVTCLCPSTEANLGDGLFPLADYLAEGGRIAIGSDSHASINPFEELRWLEYGQRLRAEQRNIAAIDDCHTGRSLYERAAAGGAQASGVAGGRIEPGAVADLLLFDDEDPMLAGHATATLLDALVFCGFRLPLERVMVAGRWQVEDGRHVARAATRAAYRGVAGEVAAAFAELDA